VGFATDPDVDRLALVSDEGRAIGEDYTLALATRVVLRHRTGAVVTNLSTSRIVDDMAASAGPRCYRAPVGEVNVALAMRDAGAVIGGEGNGGVILPELHLGRDAPLGAALLLQLLHEDGEPLSKIVAKLPAVRHPEGQARPPRQAAGRRVRGADGRLPRCRGRHAGRPATGVGGPLGARQAVGHRAHRARDRRGPHGAGGAGVGR
jgi:phosphomannomutase